MMQATSTVDLSGARRMQGLLNGLRNVGFVLAGFLLLFSIADRRLLIGLAIFFPAGVFFP